MKIPNKRKVQQLTSSHTSDKEFKDFMKLYKDYTKEPYSFLAWTIATLSSGNQYKEIIIKITLSVRNLKQSITKSIRTRLNIT